MRCPNQIDLIIRTADMAVNRYLVNDVEVALEFYITILGFELVEKWGLPFAIVKRGDLTLWLSGPGSSASRPLADGSKPVPGGWNRLVLETHDLVSLVEKLKQSGAQLRSEIVSGPGGKQILVNDPSGNPVELFESSGK
jgi:catechol 2,3-dioxygenase-like lactoylglutathione lyase family enzyme